MKKLNILCQETGALQEKFERKCQEMGLGFTRHVIDSPKAQPTSLQDKLNFLCQTSQKIGTLQEKNRLLLEKLDSSLDPRRRNIVKELLSCQDPAKEKLLWKCFELGLDYDAIQTKVKSAQEIAKEIAPRAQEHDEALMEHFASTPQKM